jgi:glycine cleavage system aminomethyltransferase T
VAKILTGIMTEATGERVISGVELNTLDGKPAGKITSVTFSPMLEKTIGLAYVRYEHLASGTELLAGTSPVAVTSLPFVGSARKTAADVQ